jgi:hypothetical protein
MPSALPFGDATDDLDFFTAVRRWARDTGLPRFVYVKATTEVKPLYVDLESPLFVRLFAKLAKRVKSNPGGETPLTIAEMLPGLDQLWLTDADRQLYTAELRIIAVDPAHPPTAAPATKDP